MSDLVRSVTPKPASGTFRGETLNRDWGYFVSQGLGAEIVAVITGLPPTVCQMRMDQHSAMMEFDDRQNNAAFKQYNNHALPNLANVWREAAKLPPVEMQPLAASVVEVGQTFRL